MNCRACEVEAELGTEECPHPVHPSVHTCTRSGLPALACAGCPHPLRQHDFGVFSPRKPWPCRAPGCACLDFTRRP